MTPDHRFTVPPPSERPERFQLFIALSPYPNLHTNRYTYLPTAELTDEDRARLLAVKIGSKERHTRKEAEKFAEALPHRKYELAVQARMGLKAYKPDLSIIPEEVLSKTERREWVKFERTREADKRWETLLRFAVKGSLKLTLLDSYNYWALGAPRPEMPKREETNEKIVTRPRRTKREKSERSDHQDDADDDAMHGISDERNYSAEAGCDEDDNDDESLDDDDGDDDGDDDDDDDNGDGDDGNDNGGGHSDNDGDSDKDQGGWGGEMIAVEAFEAIYNEKHSKK